MKDEQRVGCDASGNPRVRSQKQSHVIFATPPTTSAYLSPSLPSLLSLVVDRKATQDSKDDDGIVMATGKVSKGCLEDVSGLSAIDPISVVLGGC